MARVYGALIAALCLGLGGPRAVAAHAAFVSSTPAPDSTVTALPAQVVIVFSQAIMRSSTIVVSGPSGRVVSGATTVEGNRAATALQDDGQGVYRVAWANVSAEDGHESSGSFQFTVAAAPAPVPAAPAPGVRPALPVVTPAARAAPRAGTGTGVGASPATGAAALLLVVGVGVVPALIRRRHRPSR
jgi:methionine-rich copper-binding protein CopC